MSILPTGWYRLMQQKTPENADYVSLLALSGLSKRQLALRLGVSPDTAIRWREKPPKYVIRHLEWYVWLKESWERFK